MPEFEIGAYLETETGQTLAMIVQTDPVLVSYEQPYGALLEMHGAAPGKIADHFDSIAVRVWLASCETQSSLGRIVFTDNTLDADGNLRIWAEMPNPDGVLVPSLPVTVSLQLEDGDQATE